MMPRAFSFKNHVTTLLIHKHIPVMLTEQLDEFGSTQVTR